MSIQDAVFCVIIFEDLRSEGMRFIERLVWGVAFVVIAAALYIAWQFKPSLILRIDIPPPKVVEPRQMRTEIERFWRQMERKQKTSSGESDKNSVEGIRRRIVVQLRGLLRKYPSELTRSYFYPDRKLVDKYSNWNEALRVAKAVSATLLERDGRIVGIRIDSLPANSPLREYVGLQPGDVITSICGEMPQASSEMEMMREAKALFDRLREQDILYLEIKRGGRPMLITVQFQR